MRKLATVDLIKEIRPIDNANNVELAIVRNWQVVVKKGEFKVGDKVIYLEIDSLLPVKEEYNFLKNCYIDNGIQEGYRIKTVKLCGQLSQGLVLPLNTNAPVGADLTEKLNVKKYEPPISLSIGGDALGQFPSFIRKTDEERIQNLETIPSIDKTWKVTEKLDGTSVTIYAYYGEDKKLEKFGVCSRNLELKNTPHSIYWNYVRKTNLLYYFQSLPEIYLDNLTSSYIVIQGELIGEGIQKNRYKIKHQEFYVFSVYIKDLTKRVIDKIISKDTIQLNKTYLLDCLYLQEVPYFKNVPNLTTLEEYLAFAEGKSYFNPDVEREGIVVRDENEDVSFKVISNKYLLKEK